MTRAVIFLLLFYKAEVILMEQNIYEKKSIPSLILHFSIPAIFSLVVEVMSSVIDTAFAGHLKSGAVDALTAMGVLSPVLSLYTAIQALFAVSTSIMVAKNLNHRQRRNEYFIVGLLMTCVTGILVFILSFLGMPRLFSIIGAKGQVGILAEKYLKIQLFSNLFSAMGYTLTSCIRAFGYPVVEMVLTGVSVLMNVIFNIIFVFIFRMGFQGLAYGTLVSELVCFVALGVWIVRHKLYPRQMNITFRKIRAFSFELFKLGIAQTIIQSLAGCMGVFVNRSLLLYTSSDYIAVWNVVQKIYTIFLMPIVGITQGVQTIVAYFSGYQEEIKKKKTLIITIIYTVLYGFIGMGIVFFFSKTLFVVFTGSKSIYHIGKTVLWIVFSTFPLMGIFYTMMTLHEVTGHEVRAVLLILTRQVLFLIPLMYVLPMLIPEVPCVIFYAVPIADILAMIIVVLSIK